MLYLIVAVPCEARPLIDYYRLRAHRGGPCPIFESGAVRLVVSGAGKGAAATACAALHAEFGASADALWLNVGTAGHDVRPLGQGVLARRIVDGASGACWEPALPPDLPCPSDTLLTVDRPALEYQRGALYDMEGAGFYPAARRYGAAGRVQCFKVISDNRTSGIWEVSEDLAGRLIAAQLATIEALTRRLCDAPPASEYGTDPP